jgi:hypothetical protein
VPYLHAVVTAAALASVVGVVGAGAAAAAVVAAAVAALHLVYSTVFLVYASPQLCAVGRSVECIT